MQTQETEKPFVAARVVQLIVKRKWIILIIGLVSGVAGYLYALSLPNYYKSTINCVPAANEQSLLGGSLGSLGGALKDIGLSKLSKGSSESFEFIVVLYTRQIRDSMIRKYDLVRQYEMEGEPMHYVREAFEDNLEVNLRAEGNYEITIWSESPQQSVEMCQSFVNYANDVANAIARKEALKTTGYLQSRIRLIDSALSALSDSMAYYSKTYLMFSPMDQAKSSATALAAAKTMLLEQETVLGLLQRSYGADDPQTKAQAGLVEQLRTQYSDLTSKPGFVGDYSIRDAAGIGSSFMKLVAEFEAHSKLKAFILPTLEQAQLDQAKSTPSLIVVDDPVPAEKKDRPKRSLYAAGSALGASLLVIALMLIWYSLRDLLRPLKENA
ncbi:MAG: hypothetical protein J5I53_01030 [Bradyrhizobiaceae bacterium]|nr:hypothetical protein [Bradyrhizobiaceae bacterium]